METLLFGHESRSIIACALASWSPKIGDPTVMGWLTVVAYLLCALIAGRVLTAVTFPAQTARREQLFWGALMFLMLALAINKQLDLQSFLTAIGRCDAKAQGWYGERRLIQREFIFVLLGLILLSGAVLFHVMRRTLPRTGLPLLGLVLVAGFVLVRAVSFHHVDDLINTRALGIRMNWVLELSGLVLIFWGAWRLLRKESG